MQRVILTDLAGISAVQPSNDEAKWRYALHRLNIFTQWPTREPTPPSEGHNDPFAIPFLTYCEFSLWRAYLPLSHSLDKFVLELDWLRKPKECLPLEVIVHFEAALKLGVFSSLTVRTSHFVGDSILLAKRNEHGSQDLSRYYLLARWHSSAQILASLEDIKDYLRGKISRKRYGIFDFGWTNPEEVLEACCEHDRLVQHSA